MSRRNHRRGVPEGLPVGQRRGGGAFLSRAEFITDEYLKKYVMAIGDLFAARRVDHIPVPGGVPDGK